MNDTSAGTPGPTSAASPPEAPSLRRPIRRAIVSVYDKTGLTELVEGLAAAGVELVSTGRTAATLAEAGVPVTPIEKVTGFPECLDGRVKTLHPAVHAGLLADRNRPEHERQLADLEIEPFDLLVSNLYPFVETVAGGGTPEEIVEQIDIGGPAMVRSAAKNHGSVAVVVSPERYADVLDAVARGGFTAAERRHLAAEAFAHVAEYDVAIADWFFRSYDVEGDPAGAETAGTLPAFTGATWRRAAILRYGENPHQRAALYTNPVGGTPGLAQAETLHGKEMSYNNYVDADAARRAAYDFAEPCVAIIKHANPCGIAIGADLADAHAKAHACDPVSAFGGVIAANGPVTKELAEQIAPIFTEVVVAPGFEPEALEILTRKKNIRLLRARPAAVHCALEADVERRQITGGLLVQEADRVHAPGDDPASWRLVAGSPVDAGTLADLAFAWRAVRAVKSNAILLAHDGATVGVGMGQVNRVDSARLAVARASERVVGSVAASDAFFPFPDGLEVLTEAGVAAVVEPGGSVRDEAVVEAAASAGVALYFTGARHFYH